MTTDHAGKLHDWMSIYGPDEQLAALDRLVDDLRATEKLATDERERRIAAEAERDAWSDAHDAAQEQVIVNHHRAEAAVLMVSKLEAERDRLREALEIILTADPSFSVTTAQILQWWINVCEVARAALAPSATGGDS